MPHFSLSDDVLSKLARARRVSEGELEALKLALNRGKSKDIAHRLGISEAAARKRLGEVYRKFGIKGKGPGKLRALEQHLITQAQQTATPAGEGSGHLSGPREGHISGSAAGMQTSHRQADERLPLNPDLKTQYCLNEAPAIAPNHVRRELLDPLKQWILAPARQTKLLAICGMGGVGKTTLTLNLAQELNGYFEQVIWLRTAPSKRPHDLLKALLSQLSVQLSPQSSTSVATQVETNISSKLPPQTASAVTSDAAQRPEKKQVKQPIEQPLEQLIEQLISCFSEHRYLVVLDGYETVFSQSTTTAKNRVKIPTFEASRQQQASLYREGFEGYGTLLHALQQHHTQTQSAGGSCLILTSREQPIELLEGVVNQASSHLWVLQGLEIYEAARLLSPFHLQGNSADFRALAQRYRGHPMALRLAADAINSVFSGQIKAFLAQGISVFDEVRTVLNQQFSRLSDLEEEALYWLAINSVPSTLEALQADVVAEDHKINLLYTLRSLERRFLIEVIPVDDERYLRASYQLHPLIEEYVLSRLVRHAFNDLIQGDLSFFNRYALMKADADDSCRVFQKQFVVQPILKRLQNYWKSSSQVDRWLGEKLDDFREQHPYRLGYAGGNFVNLMVVLSEGKLTHKNFSQLTIWQAYLQGAELKAVNFNRCKLNRSVFTDTLSDVMCLSFNQIDYLANHSAGHRASHSAGPSSPSAIALPEPLPIPLTTPLTTPLLACGDTHGSVHVWRSRGPSADSGQKLTEWSAHNGWVRSLSLIPDQSVSRQAMSSQQVRLATGGDDNQIKLWQMTVEPSSEASTRAKLLWQKKTDGWVRALAVSPDGQVIASGSENTITLHRVRNGQKIAEIRHQPELSNELSKPIHLKGLSLAFSPDNQWLASCGRDDVIRLWPLADVKSAGSTQLSPTKELTPAKELIGHTDWVRAMQFSSDSQRLVSGSYDGTTRIWEIDTGKCQGILSQAGELVQAIALSPKGKLLASGSDDGHVRLWDVSTQRLLTSLTTQSSREKSRVSAVGFQQQGDHLFLAAGGDKQTLKLWQVHSVSPANEQLSSSPSSSGIAVRPVRTYRGYTNGIRALSFLGAQHIISGGDGCDLAVWDSVSGEHKANLSLHQGRIWAIALDKHNARIASASDDHTIRLWDANTGHCLTTFTEHTNWVRGLDFSRRGRLLASGGDDATIRIWNTTSGYCVKAMTSSHHWIHSVAFDPTNSRYLVSGGDEGVVRHWRRKEGISTPMAQHEHRISAVVFSPDGRLIASGSDDSTVIVWDVQKNEQLYHFTSSELGIKTVAFSPNGRYLAAAGEDQIVYLWDLRSPDQANPDKTCRKLQPQSLVGLTGGIRAIAFSPDSNSLISGGLDATIRIADLTGLTQSPGNQSPDNQSPDNQSPDNQSPDNQSPDNQFHEHHQPPETYSPPLKPLIQPARPYENIEIEGVKGLSHLQMSNLLSLGAVNRKKSLFL